MPKRRSSTLGTLQKSRQLGADDSSARDASSRTVNAASTYDDVLVILVVSLPYEVGLLSESTPYEVALVVKIAESSDCVFNKLSLSAKSASPSRITLSCLAVSRG